MEKFDHLREAICNLVSIAEDSVDGELFKELDEAGVRITNCLEELEEYKNAEEQGLLLRLPVEIKGYVYTTIHGDVSKHKVYSYSTAPMGLGIIARGIYGKPLGIVGKSVFATKEEAEQALAEMRNIEEAKDNLATEIARIGYTDKADARERIEQALK